MSEQLQQLIERATTDAAFRAALHQDPVKALAGYSLTAEEKAALLASDAGGLGARGVDARITKMASGQTTPDNGPWDPSPFSS
jgi:hypothetical protein